MRMDEGARTNEEKIVYYISNRKNKTRQLVKREISNLWVDFSFSFTWLFLNSSKENFQCKWPVEIYSLMINQGYNINDQLNFILTMIKRDYNTNDRLKFILKLIKWDYGLNDRSKLA